LTKEAQLSVTTHTTLAKALCSLYAVICMWLSSTCDHEHLDQCFSASADCDCSVD